MKKVSALCLFINLGDETPFLDNFQYFPKLDEPFVRVYKNICFLTLFKGEKKSRVKF